MNDWKAQIAQQMMQRAGGPVNGQYTWANGLNDLSQKIIGALLAKQAGEDAAQQKAIATDERKRAMADIVGALSGRPAETQQVTDTGYAVSGDPNNPVTTQTGTAGQQSTIKWNEEKPDPMRAIARAMSREDTAPLGSMIMQGQQQQQQFDRTAGLQREMVQGQQAFQASQGELDRANRLEVARMQKAASQGGDPASIKEWQAFNTMAPADQERYLTMKRAAPTPLNLGDRYVQPSALVPGQAAGQFAIGTKPMTEIDQATGRVITVPGQAPPGMAPIGGGMPQGAPTGPTATDIPRTTKERSTALDAIDQRIALVDRVLNFKNREDYTGPIQGRLPSLTDAGTGFDSMIGQLQGNAFLQAFDSLKGGGQITQIEGEKATNAIARLSTTQGDLFFEDSMKELRSVLERAKARTQGVPEDRLPALYEPEWLRKSRNDQTPAAPGRNADGFSIREIP